MVPDNSRTAKRAQALPINRVRDPVHCPAPKRKKVNHQSTSKSPSTMKKTTTSIPAQDSLRVRVVDKEQNPPHSLRWRAISRSQWTPRRQHRYEMSFMRNHW